MEGLLSKRELEVLLAFAQTGSTAEVGRLLKLSAQTVRNHLHAIHAALNVKTSVEAVWTLRHELENVTQTWELV